MELIVLGARGGWPTPGTASSGYLLRQDGFNLWIDSGTGTMANLQEHVALEEIDALVVSHQHPDHFLDIYPLYLARFYRREGRLPALPLYCPPGFVSFVTQLGDEETRANFRAAYDVHEVEPGSSFESGPFRVQTRQMRHLVPTLGFRVQSDSAVLTYTADTGPTEVIEELARDADVLLSEATWLDEPQLLPFHLSAGQAGEHAARAGVRRLVLTHIWPTHDAERSMAQAAETYDGELSLAVEGLDLKVGE